MNIETPDLLYGVAQIAAHLGLTERQAGWLHESGDLPTFKLGNTVCARRSTLAAHFAEQERQADAKALESGSRLGRLGGKTVIVGMRAIADYLDITIPAAGKLHSSGAIATYLDRRGRVSVKVDDLNAYKSGEGN